MQQESTHVLNVPKTEPVRYKRNFIETCVCELKFPTILELETKPPVGLQRKLRKKYPVYTPGHSFEVGPTGDATKEIRYNFKSKNARWNVGLRSYSIALETTGYIDFGDFMTRLRFMLSQSKSLLDTDFFTRVGLRYVNKVPIDDGILRNWINPALISPLASGELGSLEKYYNEMRGHSEFGQYSFRHGTQVQGDDISFYMLDYDYYEENVAVEEVEHLLYNFNRTNFSLFIWSLNHKALNWLGLGEPKNPKK